jgi:flagellin
MSTVINTNLASLYAQNNLSSAQNNLATSVMRLSSGLRINSAKDDAAGLGISQNMQSQINGVNQSVRNLTDATNLLNVADTSLGTVQDMLLRMKQLAVQGYNGSQSGSQRGNIVDELLQLNAEINNTAGRTKYNGNALLNVSAQWAGNGVAANTLDVASYDGGADTYAFAVNTIQVYGPAKSQDYTMSSTGAGKLTLTGADGSAQEVAITDFTRAGTKTIDFNQLGVKLTLQDGGGTDVTSADDLVTELSGLVISASGSAQTYRFQSGPDTATFIDINSINITTNVNTNLSNTAMTNMGTSLTGTLTTYLNDARAGSNTYTNIQWGTAFNDLVTKVDAAIQNISEQRSYFGAQVNRIAYISQNLESQSTNLQSSKSAIMDTDFAAETAKLTKGQIMQQAATAMLAQANQMPNVVLSLLK